MIHSAINISNYLISKSNPEEGGELLSNMKLQKLLYYCQGFYYALHKERLFEEKIIAWQYGPVVPEVYHQFKTYSSSGIPLSEITEMPVFSKKQKVMVDEVFDYFGQFSAIKLMNMTHSENPWISTEISSEIQLSKLEKHFQKFLTIDE